MSLHSIGMCNIADTIAVSVCYCLGLDVSAIVKLFSLSET